MSGAVLSSRVEGADVIAKIASCTLVTLCMVLLGCAEKVSEPAYAAFRYVTERGDVVTVGEPAPPGLVERGILIRQDRTTLPDGQQVIQQIWVFDPLEATPPEYRVYTTEDGFAAISGGSFRDLVITPPTF